MSQPKATYNERKTLATALGKWRFMVIKRAALERGDTIIEQGQYRQVAAKLVEQGPTDDSRRVFLSFEGDPDIEGFIDQGQTAIRVEPRR